MPAFPYNRAAFVLAEGMYFGKKLACKKYQVPKTTYTNWNKRLKTDDKLAHLVAIQSKALSQQWQEDSIRCLKQTLLCIEKAIENNPFSHKPQNVEEIELWSKSIVALAQMIKSLGDLTISSHVMLEDESER